VTQRLVAVSPSGPSECSDLAGQPVQPSRSEHHVYAEPSEHSDPHQRHYIAKPHPHPRGQPRGFGLSLKHAYGPACYRPRGCAEIIEQVATRIDARQFNPSFPATFPRHIQKAIWHFWSQAGQNICNGNQIDNHQPCSNLSCSLASDCRRIALRPD
jgi:hypothetical protein